MTTDIQTELRLLANPDIAEHSLRFFKSGKGEYGEGDKFLGIRVPALRAKAREHKDMPVSEILQVLCSAYHEERLLALILLVTRFEKSSEKERARIYKSYLANTRYINGWDLVDSSAHKIVGKHLLDKDRQDLMTLAASSSLWERRISIIATFCFIKHDQYDDTLNICRQLLQDDHDLIHKATGWMLREVGNRNRRVEEEFLHEHCREMPRTMLRYAIEKFDAEDRKHYLRAGS